MGPIQMSQQKPAHTQASETESFIHADALGHGPNVSMFGQAPPVYSSDLVQPLNYYHQHQMSNTHLHQTPVANLNSSQQL